MYVSGADKKPPSELPPPRKSLTINDLATVNNEIHSACTKWYFIGLNFGINAGELEAIKGEQRGNAAESLIAVLREFLKGSDPLPTWKRVADALDAPSVGFKAMAGELREKYNVMQC